MKISKRQFKKLEEYKYVLDKHIGHVIEYKSTGEKYKGKVIRHSIDDEIGGIKVWMDSKEFNKNPENSEFIGFPAWVWCDQLTKCFTCEELDKQAEVMEAEVASEGRAAAQPKYTAEVRELRRIRQSLRNMVSSLQAPDNDLVIFEIVKMIQGVIDVEEHFRKTMGEEGRDE